MANNDSELPIILVEDLNVALEPVDVFDPEKYEGKVSCHPEERAILREFLDWGFVDIFRQHQPDGKHYTFWDYWVPKALKRNIGWRIDYLLATGHPWQKNHEQVGLIPVQGLFPNPQTIPFWLQNLIWVSDSADEL